MDFTAIAGRFYFAISRGRWLYRSRPEFTPVVPGFTADLPEEVNGQPKEYQQGEHEGFGQARADFPAVAVSGTNQQSFEGGSDHRFGGISGLSALHVLVPGYWLAWPSIQRADPGQPVASPVVDYR